MIDDDEDNDGDQAQDGAGDVAGTAYKESLTSADGFTRGPNGRVKFNKDTKKRRRENDEDGDVDMVDADAAGARKAKKQQEAKFGHEFKAKVRLLTLSLYILLHGSLVSVAFCRKQAETSRREVWTRTRICLYRKLPKRRDGESGWGLRGSDDTQNE